MSGESANFRELFSRSLGKIVELKAEIDRLKDNAYPPIAVIGMACRFPGGGVNPEAFWGALESGVDGIRRIPPERWKVREDDPPATKWAGLLDTVDRFDAAFFRISPREATKLDPQQRLFLELTWEALEQAGQPVERLMGTPTAVFLGMSTFDYSFLLSDEDREDVYTSLGGTASTASGRISNIFGFQGASVTLDTACSSSLIAAHLACQSLRAGESDLALAGGVNLLLSPLTLSTTASLQALSPEGRCKTFDAEANGFAIGEGCGIVLLKRLADAERDGDPILAVIRASVANQDGRTASLTVPNVLSQQALIHRAHELARLSPEEIDYVETHGTGTSLGDPIEFEALRAVFGKPRADGSPCALGAVKTNVGHLAAAAGVAGFIKAVLCLQHRAIPRNLNFRTLNPRMSLEGTPFILPTETLPWDSKGKPRRAGVSSFGISGTNAHVILEEAPTPVEEKVIAQASSYLLPFSAKSPEALAALARSYQQWLSAETAAPLHDIAYTASLRRSHLEHRLCAVGATKEEMAAALSAFCEGEMPAGVVTGAAQAVPPKVVFVFAGQGTQWVGMCRELYQEEPAFREALAACDEAIRREAGMSIIEELDKPEEASRLWETQVTQPVLFAVEVALAALLRSFGIVPSAVIGHSFGEVAAAHVAGILDLGAAARLVVSRGRTAQKATGFGKMISVPVSEEEAKKLIAGREDRVSIATVNDPTLVVLSGDSEEIDAIVEQLSASGVQVRALRVDFASHCPQMDPLVPDFVRELGEIALAPGKTRMISSVTAKPVRHEELDAAYWGKNLRQTVRFSDALTAAIVEGNQVFVEVGPHPVLAMSIEQMISLRGAKGKVFPTLRRGKNGRTELLAALGALHANGYPIDWKVLFPGGGRVCALPTYPWQRERYWVEGPGLVARGARSVRDLATEMLHAVVFRRVSQPPRSHDEAPSVFLVFMDGTGVGASLAAMLEARGKTCVRVVQGEAYASLGSGAYQIDPGNPDDYRRVLIDNLGNGLPCACVVHMWSLDARPIDASTVETLDADMIRGTLSAAHLSAALSAHAWRETPKLCLVTRGAQSVEEGDAALSVSQAPLWGFGRSIALAHPELRAKLLDLPPIVTDRDVEGLAREILSGHHGETQVALRSNARYAAQLVREKPLREATAPVAFREDGSYLVTGGLGGLGRALARWMVDQGARNIVLVSRRPPSEEAERAIAAMEEIGARVLSIGADVANREDVARVMATISEKLPPLRGVIHTAGVPPTTMETTRESLLAVTAPKVRGGWNLHEATRDLALDFFVMYSSASAFLGVLGGAEYAAGNAFLDALAYARRAQGLPALSLQWGVFGEAGMHVHLKGEARAFGALDPIMPDEAHRVLAGLLAERRAVVSAMRFSTRRHLSLFPHLEGNFFWSALQDEAPEERTKLERTTTDRRMSEKLLAVKPEARKELLASHLKNVLSHIVHIEPARIAMDASLHALGMDSLMCLELRNKLEAGLGVHVSLKDILASGTVEVLLSLVERRLWPETAAEVAPTDEKPGSWVVVPRPDPEAKMRLICFPYAGGNASVYSHWVDLLPEEIELCAIQPPGRQERIREPLLETVEEMVAAIVPALLPYLDRPFAMFGHCVGAMVMYEVIRELGDKHGIEPLHVFPSGALPPRYYLLPPVPMRPEEGEFVDILRRIGFADDSILGDAESARDLLPAVSADFELAMRYECVSPRPLRMPITSFCGREDQLGPPERTAAWKEMTTARFEQVVFPGEHYFINPERGAMVRIINEELLHHVAVQEQRRAPSKWIRTNAPSRKAAMRLFCFPGAWESPAIFNAWPSLLGEGVEVNVIERPGYGDPVNEMPLRRVDDIVEFLASAIEPFLDRPFVFLGHNIGSIIMFELSRSLRRSGKPMPAHLIVAATDAPHLYWSGPIHIISTEKLLEGLDAVDVTIDADLPERLLHADGALLASYMYALERPLDIPITAVIGKDDHFVPRGALRGWRGATSAPFTLHEIDADHNLIRRSPDALVGIVKEACQGCVAGAAKG